MGINFCRGGVGIVNSLDRLGYVLLACVGLSGMIAGIYALTQGGI